MRSRRQPEQITLFLDRCLGRTFVKDALAEKGARVELHDDHFKQDAIDEDWICEVGKKRWVVLTRDESIQRRVLQRQAVESARIRLFVLVSGNLSGAEMAQTFIAALRSITTLSRKRKGPFIAKVFRDGKVSLWETFETSSPSQQDP